MFLTSLKGDVIVILGEMFPSHFYHVGQIEHGDLGRGERLQHLPGQGAGAAWGLLNKTHGHEHIKVSSVFVEGVKNLRLRPPRSTMSWKQERLKAVAMSCPSRTQVEFIRPMNFRVCSSDLKCDKDHDGSRTLH